MTEYRVQNKEALFSTIDASSNGYVLDSSLDSISHLRRILSSYHYLDSVQIISHGSTGAFNTGSAVLNSVTIPDYPTQIEDTGSSLKAAEDLLLYEGDIARGDTEQKFINDLAKITGADVAAFYELIGPTSLDGNWSIDIKVGNSDDIDSRKYSPLLAAMDGPISDDKVAGRSDNDSLYGLDGIESTTVSAEKDLVSDQASKVTDYAHITTKIDASVNAYSWTNCYDVIWSPIESAYSDIAGNNSITRYLTRTDADGIVAGYSNITTTVYADGNSNSLTNHYDANWVLTDSAYSDSAGNGSVTQYQTNTDADGNVTGYTHITTSTDSSGNSYSSTNHYDANWSVTESAYTDSAGNTSVTQYQTNTDADGNVAGYSNITTTIDADGNSNSFTNHYDANWVHTESAYSDSAGNNSVTRYLTRTDADGQVTGYTHITTAIDTNGNSYTSTNHWDTKWCWTDSAYSDSAGNSSVTQYLTRTDADGQVTGHTVITTGIDSSGNSYSSTNHYDAKWTVTESAFTDSAGNTSVTQYQTNTDADGNVVGYTHTSTTIYADGYASSWTNHYDAKWTVTESAFTDLSGNTSNSIDANNDGIISALSSIELNVFEVTGEETVPVICVCWLEEDLYKADAPYYDADGSAAAVAVMEIEFVGTAAPTVSDFLIVS